MSGDVSGDDLRRMVQMVEPTWDVRDATPVEAGFSSVYRVGVETPETTRDCYLKASPDGNPRGIPTDARLLAVLTRHTSIPVPPVLGLVDAHDDVPAPFFLTEPMPGTDLPYRDVGWVSDESLRTTARQVGECLGELHLLDAVASFGHVTAAPSRELTGGRPDGSLDDVTVTDGHESWDAFLHAWVDRELGRHAESGFADLTSRIESWCERRIEALADPYGPVLGRNDHGFHNLLLDPESGDVTAMLDWAYTLGVTPAFDFEFGAYLFSGAFMAGIPEVPDRRELVRDAMLAGYRTTAPTRAAAVETRRPLYEMLAMVRVMNDFELLRPELPEGTGEVAADGLRADVESLLEATGGENRS